MERLAHPQPRQTAQRGENNDLSEHIGGHLPLVEPQDLDGGNLPDPLGDVDIGEVVEHDERQRRRAQHHNRHNVVHAGEHAVHLAAGGLVDRDAAHALVLQQQGPLLIGVRPRVGPHIEGVVLRRPAQLALESPGGDVGVVEDVVVGNGGDRGLHLPQALLLEPHRVPHREPQLLRQPGVHHHLPAAGVGDGRLPAVEGEEPVQGVRGGHHQVDRLAAPWGLYVHAAAVDQQPLLRQPAARLQVGLRRREGLALLEGDGVIVQGDLIELVVGHVGDGIPDAEAGAQQGGAPADAQHHHHQPAAVAQHVAH